MENVLPHSTLKQLTIDLWILEGTLPYKNPLPRNMLIFRTPEKKLWVHSPVAVNDETLQVIRELGETAWIVVPNDMHRMDAATWKQEFPKAQVVCPKGARKKVEKEVHVDANCEDAFQGQPITALPMAGATRKELAYEILLEDGKALVVNDLLVNVEALPGVFGKLIELMGRIGRFRVPKPQRLVYLNQKKLFNKWLETMARKNFTIVAVSHGAPVTSDVADWLRSAANELLH